MKITVVSKFHIEVEQSETEWWHDRTIEEMNRVGVRGRWKLPFMRKFVAVREEYVIFGNDADAVGSLTDIERLGMKGKWEPA